MVEATVHLKEILLDAQEYGSDDEYMVSRVFFDLEVDTRWFRGLSADVKQVVGSQYDESVLEVSRPYGYDGPFSHSAFTAIAGRYVMLAVGQNGRAFHLGPNSRNIRFSNCRMAIPHSESFEIHA